MVDRKAVYNKYNGHCAYCGCELQKNWHIDHLKPVVRRWGRTEKPENDNFENSMPACPPCNIIKNSLPLESFRNLIKDRFRQLARISNYRTALRYSMIEEKEWDGLFYFERIQNDTRYVI